VLKNIYRDAGGLLALAIVFDEDNDKYTLFFKENPRDQRFALIYDEASGAVNYGGERYRANFSGETPYLMVKFEEEQIETPAVRYLRGRFISRDQANAGGQP
jgi:hypothetical protein